MACSRDRPRCGRWMSRRITRNRSAPLRLPGAAGPVEGVERAHVVLAELEVEDPGVLDDPLAPARLRDHDRALLDAPAEHDLHRGALEPVRDRVYGRVAERVVGS